MSEQATLLRRALLKIEELQARLDATKAASSEPIALVGVGCRLPGGLDDPEALWEFLREGGDAIGEVPPGRWDVDAVYDPEPGVPGKIYTRRGGFIPNVDRFDAAFFGISPREAAHLDPQQRLLLECAWESLERAGIAPLSLRGSLTGVYIGQATNDYGTLISGTGDAALDTYFATGTAASVASGRLSYTLGLQGPAVTMDTACSSALVALHLACNALRRRECDLALVGGVNLILSPEAVIAMCQSRMMAPDGRCKTFDAAADGFGQAEGCVVFTVKRLSDARRDGDPVLAQVRGSAVNQDGASSGLTAPNGPAQTAVIRAAFADAGIAPEACGYVEAHGTGTSLGDPIEIQAMHEALGLGRPAGEPVLTGSIKTNLGHLEAAAGLAGLLKVVLALRHETIPPHLHLNQPNPLIPWDDVAVRVADRLTPFPAPRGRRIAGLSSFGFSGTNAHIVIEQAPPPASAAAPSVDRPLRLLTLSARGEAATRDLATAYRARIADDPEASLADIAFSANTGRSPSTYRLALVADGDADATAKLGAFLDGRTADGLLTGELEGGDAPRVAFLFTGQGSQYPDMGRQLYECEPVFRAAFDDCAQRFAAHLPGSLVDVVYGEARGRLGQTQWTQPALFAIEWALAELWRSWGVKPALVIGHSIGEYVAACVAGVFALDDAVRLVAARATLIGALPGGGAMTAVVADEPQAQALLARVPQLSLAGVNGPRATVLSGPADAIDEAERRLAADEIAYTRLDVSHAFHSALLDPMLDAFAAVAAGITMAEPAITFVSTLTGQAARRGAITNAGYWRDQTRGTVRFADALRAAHALGYRVFVELGPKAVLSKFAARTLGAGSQCLTTLDEDREPLRTALGTLGRLYVGGVAIDWKSFHGPGHARLALPTYPFQRARHWIAETPHNPRTHGAMPATGRLGHPHLVQRTDTARGETIFDIALDPAAHPYLLDHRVHGAAIVPTALYLDVIASAAALVLGTPGAALDDVVIHQAIPTPPEGRALQLLLSAGQFEVFSRDGDHWVLAVSGGFGAVSPAPPRPADDDALAPLDTDGFYATMRQVGLDFGPTFHRVAAVRRRDRHAETTVAPMPAAGFGIHPAVLDGCLQAVAAALPGFDAEALDAVYMPIGIDRFELFGADEGPARGLATIEPDVGADTDDPPEVRVGALLVTGAAGNAVGRITGLRMKRAAPPKTRAPAIDGLIYEIEWRAVEREAHAAPDDHAAAVGADPAPLVFADAAGIADPLLARLRGASVAPVAVRAGTAFAENGDGFTVAPGAAGDYERLLDRLQARSALPRTLVYLWPIDAAPAPDASAEELLASLDRCGDPLLRLLQAYSRRGAGAPATLWLVTSRAQAVQPGDRIDGLVQSALFGLVKVAALEMPEITCHRLDIGQPDDVVTLADELLAAGCGEPMLAVRDGRRYVARLTPASLPEPDAERQHGIGRDLRIIEGGSFDGLALRPLPRRAPGPGEVEIAVAASGLNFRDVLNVLGARGDDATLGGEAAGVVTRVGPGVRAPSVGEAVMAVTLGGHRDFAIAPAALTLPLPDGFDWAVAAGAPLVFLTAIYALGPIGRMRAGERILIHSAAGGVGMAAIQLAQRAGLEVFATAGSAEKRAAVAATGVTHVYNSRDLDFADAIRRETGGEGIDLVLAAVTGPAIAAGMKLLRAGGRYLEIGKAELLSDAVARAINPDARYYAIDLAERVAVAPEEVRPMFIELAERLASGDLAGLPTQAFPVDDAARAFEHMARARHVGKVVLTMQDDPRGAIAATAAGDGLALVANGTYLVSGGLGGLGLATAQRLVERGARHLLLFGRSAPSPTAEATLAALRETGAEIVVGSADASREEDLEALFAGPLAAMPPLKGVIHSAGRLEDATIAQQSWSRFRDVLGPKAIGAWALHRLCARLPLDFFVLYSSVSSVLGAPGQANHAAANAFLDAFAGWRRARGLPALSINWGAWSQIGVAAGERVLQRLGRQGVAPLDVEEGLAALERALGQPKTQLAVIHADWDRVADVFANPIERRFLDALVTPAPISRGNAANENAGAPPVRPDDIRSAPLDKRMGLLDRLVRALIAEVLGVPGTSAISDSQPFREMGLDSLMALELRTRLKKALALDVPLPATMAFDHPTVAALLRYLATDLLGWETAPAAVEAPAQERNLLDDIENMSDEEIDRLLSSQGARVS